eukprot:COSAG01_NODE_1925_length_8884_cov_6.366648_5_plen_147_part_00
MLLLQAGRWPLVAGQHLQAAAALLLLLQRADDVTGVLRLTAQYDAVAGTQPEPHQRRRPRGLRAGTQRHLIGSAAEQPCHRPSRRRTGAGRCFRLVTPHLSLQLKVFDVCPVRGQRRWAGTGGVEMHPAALTRQPCPPQRHLLRWN